MNRRRQFHDVLVAMFVVTNLNETVGGPLLRAVQSVGEDNGFRGPLVAKTGPRRRL